MNIQDLVDGHMKHWKERRYRRLQAGGGRISVVSGPPNSAKSLTINLKEANQRDGGRVVQSFAYSDSASRRRHVNAAVSEDTDLIPRIHVRDCDAIHVETQPHVDAVFVDDAAEITGDLQHLAFSLSLRGVDSVFYGRDLDEAGRPATRFGNLMCEADSVEKLLVFCRSCGASTNRWRSVRQARRQFDIEFVCRVCGADGGQDARAGGWLEVLIGPPRTGKRNELARLATSALTAGQNVQVFYPEAFPDRLPQKIRTPQGKCIEPKPINSVSQLLSQIDLAANYVFVYSFHGLSETHQEGAAEDIDALATRGLKIHLDSWGTDELGAPIRAVADLLCLAERSRIMDGAPCNVCKRMDATRTQRAQDVSLDYSGDRPEDEASSMPFLPVCRQHSVG